MAVVDLADWLDDFGRPGFIWCVKRLSGNDTLANNTHQAGPYIPKEFLFSVFPSLNRSEVKNPDAWFDLYVDSHADHKKVRAVWYNNRLRGGTRNEARLTNFGGRGSALLDPDSTGALAVFAFLCREGEDAQESHVWVCRTAVEEDLIEERVGSVDPGSFVVWSSDMRAAGDLIGVCQESVRSDCRLARNEIPQEWLVSFPSGEEIVRKAVAMQRAHTLDPDERLIRRRQCEFDIFLSIEEAVELPVICAGFCSIEQFILRAQKILQRRKSRSGRSLELHAKEIFLEEGLLQGMDFDHQQVSEQGKTPDFLFPSAEKYRDSSFPESRLRMLAVKTTFRDRWRQVLEEADRIRIKHLLTLQEGVSVNQFRQISDAGIRLVVPTAIHSKYPRSIRSELVSLESFIADVRLLKL